MVEVADEGGFFGGEVGGFAEVGFEVLEFEASGIGGGEAEPADEFVVAGTDPDAAGAAGTLAVGEVVEEGAAIEGAGLLEHC